MRLNLTKNWIAKILSLLLATAIWFLINDHLGPGRYVDDGKGPDAYPTEYDANGNPIPKAKPAGKSRQ